MSFKLELTRFLVLEIIGVWNIVGCSVETHVGGSDVSARYLLFLFDLARLNLDLWHLQLEWWHHACALEGVFELRT